jgi:hypothetical protein
MHAMRDFEILLENFCFKDEGKNVPVESRQFGARKGAEHFS